MNTIQALQRSHLSEISPLWRSLETGSCISLNVALTNIAKCGVIWEVFVLANSVTVLLNTIRHPDRKRLPPFPCFEALSAFACSLSTEIGQRPMSRCQYHGVVQALSHTDHVDTFKYFTLSIVRSLGSWHGSRCVISLSLKL